MRPGAQGRKYVSEDASPCIAHEKPGTSDVQARAFSSLELAPTADALIALIVDFRFRPLLCSLMARGQVASERNLSYASAVIHGQTSREAPMATPRKNDTIRNELPPPQQQAELNPRQLPKELRDPEPPTDQHEQKG